MVLAIFAFISNLEPSFGSQPYQIVHFIQGFLDYVLIYTNVLAIVACHNTLDVFSLWADKLITTFLKQARCLHSPSFPKNLAWDLTLVLELLKGPLYESMKYADLKLVSLKSYTS